MIQKTSLIELINHLKLYGFIFQGSEMYDGLKHTWDYGPLGIIMKNNIKKLWIEEFINKDDNFLVDSSIFLKNDVWKASKHEEVFFDSMVDCRDCKNRFRIDEFNIKNLNIENINSLIDKKEISCLNCKSTNLTKVHNFNLMFKTNFGPINNKNSLYLRPELAQGIIINFFNVQKSLRLSLPFGIGQIGKSFRNEITTNKFIYKTREFEQMELEYFFDPVKQKEPEIFSFFEKKILYFLNTKLSLKNIKTREISEKELAHYSKRTIDFQFKFLDGKYYELCGLADRGNYDLTEHLKRSTKNLFYLDPKTHKKIIPHIIEPSFGIDRLILAIFIEAYKKEKLINNRERIFLNFSPQIAPFQISINPLAKDHHKIALELYMQLKCQFRTTIDFTGNVGKRYRRQDAIGTPFCITVDFESLKNDTVTVRKRNSMKQERIQIKNLSTYFSKKIHE